MNWRQQQQQQQQRRLYTEQTVLATFRRFFNSHPNYLAEVRQLPGAERQATTRRIKRRVEQLLQTWQAQQMHP